VFALIGEGLSDRLAAAGNRIDMLASSKLSDEQVIESLYWEALTRPPSPEERDAATALLAASHDNRAVALQDLAWALLNAKEFLFRR
jgi:hypothetical protein